MSDAQVFTDAQCLALFVLEITHTDVPPCPCDMCRKDREVAELRSIIEDMLAYAGEPLIRDAAQWNAAIARYDTSKEKRHEGH